MEDQTDYTPEGEVEIDPQERIEELQEDKARAKTNMVIFLVLFLLALGLLVYYQFYQGHGKWKITFKHKDIDTIDAEAMTGRLTALQSRSDSLQIALTAAQQEAETKASAPASMTGTVYEVQIGAFRSFDLSKYKNNMSTMELENDGGMMKVTVGRFRSYSEADAFRKDIQKMGIRKAWVVKKLDGQRQPVSAADMKGA